MAAEPTINPNPDIVRIAVRDKLDEKLPDEWHVYERRDFSILAGDEFPAVYCVSLVERLLEEESDNQELVGYPVGVAIMRKELAMSRETDDFSATRRTAQQAVYTTNYAGTGLAKAGLIVEQIMVEEGLAGVTLPGAEEMVTATGFTVVIGLLENRETIP